jgi:hypothetical protein
MLHDAWRTYRLGRLNAHGRCHVLSSRYQQRAFAESGDENQYEVIVRFVHERGGERFERVDQPDDYATSNAAIVAVRRYRAGADVDCYYRSDDPGVVALRPRGRNEWVLSSVFGGLLIAIPLVATAFSPSRRNRQR